MTLDDLKKECRWVCWRVVKKDGRDTKPPFQITGQLARNNDPSNWSTHAECEAAFAKGGFAGVGMILGGGLDKHGNPLTPIVGIDGDSCVDEDHKFSAESRELVIRLDSYSEYSPSESGFHCWVLAELGDRKGIQKPYPGCKQVEVKANAYYHTFTGRHLVKTPKEILPRQEQVDELYARLQAGVAGQAGLVLAVPEDEQAKFDKLWAGDTSTYDNNHSRADLALCCILARRYKNNFWDIDEQFRESGLFREKWLRKDYSSQTILKAIAANQAGFENTELEEEAPADWIIEPLPGCTDGWFPTGELSLVGGSSGAGKTHLLIHILVNLGKRLFEVHETKNRDYALLLLDRGRAAFKRTCEGAKLPSETIEHLMDRAIKLSDTQIALGPAKCLEAAILKRPQAKVWVIEGFDIWTGNVNDMDQVSRVLHDIIAIAARHRVAVIGTVGSPKQKENDRYAAGRDQFMGTVVFGRMAETCISLARTSDPQVRKMHIMTRNTRDENFWFTWGEDGFSLTTEPIELAELGKKGKALADSALHMMEMNVFATFKAGEQISYSESLGSWTTFSRWRTMAKDAGKLVQVKKKWFRAAAS